MTIMERLAEIRQMGGRDPLPDSTKVSGFGPNDPPVGVALPLGPPLDPDLPPDWIDPELDEGKEPAYMRQPSPLIPRASAPPAPLATPNLMVADRAAAWKGRVVTLSEADEARIREVVLVAMRRELDADLDAVSQKRPRAPRKPRVKLPTSSEVMASAAAFATDGEPSAPKRRGRPRGSLLRTQP